MLACLKTYLVALLRRDEGATMIEYALLAVLIGVALVATIILIGSALQGAFSDVADGFEQ